MKDKSKSAVPKHNRSTTAPVNTMIGAAEETRDAGRVPAQKPNTNSDGK